MIRIIYRIIHSSISKVIFHFKFLFSKRDIKISWKSHIGKTCSFEPHTRVNQYCSLSNTSLGRFSYVGSYCIINNATIGNFCSIAPSVKMGLGEHPSSIFVSTSPYFFLKRTETSISLVKEDKFKPYKEIVIGNDVWIGANSYVKDGVKIGDGAIIAAGSIVVKNVAPYSIVGGIPAKEIKKRFSEGEISLLLESQWWNNDIDWLQENANLFTDIKSFLSKSC